MSRSNNDIGEIQRIAAERRGLGRQRAVSRGTTAILLDGVGCFVTFDHRPAVALGGAAVGSPKQRRPAARIAVVPASNSTLRPRPAPVSARCAGFSPMSLLMRDITSPSRVRA